MSATLDGARVAALLDGAPVVESEGRAFPVETRYLGRDARARIEPQVADAVHARLARRHRLAAGVPARRRRNPPHRDAAEGTRRAIPRPTSSRSTARSMPASRTAPSRRRRPGRRKVVLATSIAETSLTIEGVRVVIDSGLSRVPRYEPDVGLTRLETVRVSRAAADQRRGRAGRTEPGVCYRLWDEPQTGSLEAYTRPEILSADLSSFVLDLAQWGVERSCDAVVPRSAAAGRAQRGARAAARARRHRSLTAASPRKAASFANCRCRRGWRAWWSMPAREGAGLLAADIAAVLTERGLGGDDVDLRHRLDQFRRDRSRRADDARAMAKRWADTAARKAGRIGIIARRHSRARLSRPHRQEPRRRQRRLPARQWPRRPSRSGLGAGARAVPGGGRTDRYRGGKPHRAGRAITLEEIEARFADQIEDRDTVTFDSASASLRARRTRRLGALVLAEQIKPVTPDADTARILAEGIVGLGLDRLPWSKAARQFRDRVRLPAPRGRRRMARPFR